MNMHESGSGMDAVVFLALALAIVFFAVWMFSPRLRRLIERPKFRFADNVKNYDESLER